MRLWFYVPDYPKVRDELEAAYARFSVEEWSVEPGRVADLEDDADVTVEAAEPAKLLDFRAYLEESGIEGLMIEGEEV